MPDSSTDNRAHDPALALAGPASPVTARSLVWATFRLYRRYPLLFPVLAAGLLVPYDAIVLAVTGRGPLDGSSAGSALAQGLTMVETGLVGSLISALHVHAVKEIREGRGPRLITVARQGLTALPVVAVASVVAWLGVAVGLFLLVVPGIILMLRWYVVAQTAAVEKVGWRGALERSHRLVEGHYRHVLAVLLYTLLVPAIPNLLFYLWLGGDTDVVSFVVGLFLQILTWSFGALVSALLYFDLRGRAEAGALGVAPEVQTSWDPRDHPDASRPRGWYVDLDEPSRMRYWAAGDSPGWSGSARTPRKIRKRWSAASSDAG